MRREQVLRVTGTVSGSGYLIAPRLVLTSAHVVGESTTTVEVFRPGAEGRYAGMVVWCGRAGQRTDAALVHLTDPAWQPPAMRPVVWGRTVTHQPRIACQMWGMPDFAQRRGAATEFAQHTGRLNPGSGLVGNRHIVELDDHPPGDLGESPWQGISGAAVYCDGLLTGVVAADPEHRRHAALAVVPAYVLLAQPGFRAAVEEHAGPLGLRWEPVELQGLMDHQSPLRNTAVPKTPASLLIARRAVVPFRRPGREELLAELEAWAGEAGLGVWLLHGGGGQGKTRLAHFFGEQLARQRWSVLWLDPNAASSEQLQVLGRVVTPLLVIVDYAESRIKQLLALFGALAAQVPDHPVRVLLLARTIGDWWNQLAAGSGSADEAVELARITALPPLDATNEAREATYRAAVEAFANALPGLRDSERSDWDRSAAGVLSMPYRGLGQVTTVLGVQMHALADLLDTATCVVSSGSGRSLEDRVLVHERRYWDSLARSHDLTGLGTPVLEDAVAATVVLNPGTATALDGVIERVPELKDQPRATRAKVRGWLMSLYPGQIEGVFGGLAPDRIAEHLAGRLMLDHTRPCIIETLATTTTSSEETEHLLTVCTRAAAHPTLAPAVGQRLTQWCAQNPDTLLPAAIRIATRVETPDPLIAALDQVIATPTTNVDTLKNLHDLIPDQTQVLGLTATALLETLVHHFRRAKEVDTPGLAVSLNNLAIHLGELGRREDGLAAIEEAVEIYRLLTEQRPDAFRPDRAMSLNNLANCLGELGRHEDGLAAIEEAVEIYRLLTEQRPDAFRPALASTLNNLANRLGELGRREDGLAAAEEAVEIYRLLTEQHPDAFRPDLASTLNNLANRLGELGRHEDGLAAIEEAVEIYRLLTEQRPDAFRPDLASSLNNLAVRLWELGRREDGLAAIEEAVEIYRLLTEQHPDAFRPDLAMSLNNLAVHLGRLSRREDGLAAAEEAVEIRRVLTEQRPDAFRPDLASSLNNLANRLVGLGRHEDGLAAIEEAVEIRRVLTEQRPDAFRPDLASSLNNLAVHLGWLSRREDGLAAIEETVEIYRSLDGQYPKMYRSALDRAQQVAAWLSGLGPGKST